MSKPITCPNCGYSFDYKEAQITEEQEMIDVLFQHGYSLRAIGRVLGGMHPEAVKYRLQAIKRGKKV